MEGVKGQVYAVVADTIRARIAKGELLPGQRLPSIQQLARDFAVGTGSVREAARVLAAQRLIRIKHGHGIFVSDDPAVHVDPSYHFRQSGTGSILAAYEARRILEPELAALAAERAMESDIRTICDLAQAMDLLAVEGGDFAEPDVRFHRQIAIAAQNPVLARMLDGLNDLLLAGRRLTGSRPDSVQRSIKYHTLIAGAIADRTPYQARLLMLAHVNDALTIVVSLSNGRHTDGGLSCVGTSMPEREGWGIPATGEDARPSGDRVSDMEGRK